MSELKDAVLAKSFEQNGKIKLACGSAFALAEALDIKLTDISRICEEEDIRICKCQLGCF